MRRIVLSIVFCGLVVGCSGSSATPATDAESQRRAEEEAKREGQREDAAEKARIAEEKKKNKGKKPVNPDGR